MAPRVPQVPAARDPGPLPLHTHFYPLLIFKAMLSSFSPTYLTRLLLLICLAGSVLGGCPTLPSTCSCEEEPDTSLVVVCDGALLSAVAKDLGSSVINRLRLVNCSQPAVGIKHLPTGRIRNLEISNCNVKSVDNKVFVRLSKGLEELNLSNNSLTQIPKVGSMPLLHSINLNSNKISTIPEKVFEQLPKLRQLRLENNKICSMPKNALKETKSSVELIDLSGNCLGAVPAQNLRSSPKLMYLDLSDNKISEVNNYELMNLPVLRELRLNNNQLSTIHPMAFMNVPQLQYIYLRNNLLANLDGKKLQAFKQLQVLDVSNNMLQKLPSLKDLSNLRHVRLDGNLIDRIDTLTFSNNPQLQMISIQNNNINQISRNSFDSLDQLVMLLLANNSIKSIERGMLDGMKNLQQLNLRNNTVRTVDNSSFASLPHLTSLDLAHNNISNIAKGAFSKQPKLFWLDISNNRLKGFEKETFTKKISNILLDGNPLECDDAFDWFVQYLVSNRVRTFLPFQKEISCHGPDKYAGTRLKDLMIKKANDTITAGIKTLGLDKEGTQKSLLSAFIPSLGGQSLSSLGGLGGTGTGAAGIPILSTITQAIPSLRNIPGMQIPSQTGNKAAPVPGAAANVPTKNINGAIEQFTGPLVRFATGGQPVASDITQLIQSIPNFVVQVPGLGDVDISKLDPNLVAHVLRGGQIPGIPKETLDSIVQQYMQKMHEVAAASSSGKKVSETDKKYLPPMDKLPQGMVSSVVQGENLPGLNKSQTQTILDYYTAQMPTGEDTGAVEKKSGNAPAMLSLSPEMMEVFKMLPPGYNISKIPAEILSIQIIGAVSQGKVPDLSKLPKDLLEHFKHNTDKMAKLFEKAQNGNASLEEMLSKLPHFEKPVLATFSPYDINELTSEMIHEEQMAERAATVRFYSAIALGLVGAITIIVIGIFVVYVKRHRKQKAMLNVGIADATAVHPGAVRSSPMNSVGPGAPLANSTMARTPEQRTHN